jgi:replication factor C subunit 3/5
MNIFTPWVEKYRPNSFEDIVLDPINKKILGNIIEMEHFPNLLFYGPPGTGKTTSVINLIQSYQKKCNRKNLMIHLNASDERGIDIIRNQINTFVNSKSLFNDGMKFVILDEVDYMTKNAQIALRYLLQDYKANVRFCLICNYISRIDEALQNEFVRLRFNQLPEAEIINFLSVINEKENLQYNSDTIHLIQKIFNSDIRSMINYMQSNEQIIHDKKIIQQKLWDEISINMRDHSLKYIIRHKKEILTSEFLQFAENIIHITEVNSDYILHLTILKMKIFLTNSVI